MTRKTILAIDPDEAIGALLTLILEEQGYTVVRTFSLPEAAKLLSDAHFDLIITEAFKQPDPFDFDPIFLEEFRSLSKNTPIILLSYYASTDSLRAGDFGLVDVVPKPFDVGALVDIVNKQVGKREPKPDPNRHSKRE
ncbi:MAG: response regulator [Chloroflexi bacterium]|nr:response regulator [Chloroflexota bacterium]